MLLVKLFEMCFNSVNMACRPRPYNMYTAGLQEYVVA